MDLKIEFSYIAIMNFIEACWEKRMFSHKNSSFLRKIFGVARVCKTKENEPLVTNRRCLTWLCVYPPDESTSRWERIFHNIFFATTLAVQIGTVAAYLVFSWKFASIHASQSVLAFMGAVMSFNVAYMALVGRLLLGHKIRSIFDHLSTIYKASKGS